MNAFNETGPSRVDDEVKNLLKTDVPNEVERKLHRRAQAIAETLPENRTWSFDLWPFTRLRWAVASALTLIAAGVVTLILPALLVTSLPSDDVLARTVEAMRNAKTLIWEFDPGHDESEGFLNRRTWMAPNLLRVDITHQDFLNETTWVYEDKVVKFNRLNNHVNIMQNFPGMWEVGSAERTASTGTPGKLIDRLLEGDYRFETAIERDGLTLNRYVRTTNPDRHQYLFDAETFLPVEVRDVSSEYMHGAEVGKRKILTRYRSAPRSRRERNIFRWKWI